MIFTRVAEAVPAATAEDALAMIRRVVDDIENQYTTFPREEHPPFDSERMYGPLEDRVTRHVDGSMTAETAREWVFIGRSGSIRIESKTGRVLLEKPGRTGVGDDA